MWTLLQSFDLPFSGEYVNQFILSQIKDKQVNFQITLTCDFETNDLLKKLPTPYKLYLNDNEVQNYTVSKNIYKKTEFILNHTGIYDRNLVSKTGYIIKSEPAYLTFNGHVKIEVEYDQNNPISTQPENNSSCVIV